MIRVYNDNTYPRVEINPQTVPSANREIMSPICRKDDGDSFMMTSTKAHYTQTLRIQ